MGTDPLNSSPAWGTFTVSNGSLGPVLWCPKCNRQIGYLDERVSIQRFITDAYRHNEAEHGGEYVPQRIADEDYA